jgi:PhzF family phenazine biosynthesis protein
MECVVSLQSIYQVDAFADAPFTGNPAAVCVLERPRDDAWMQAVAAEMNLSETAFVRPADAGWGLRWFTPLVEFDLCGHATLASAHVLYATDRLAPDETARFQTRSGVLTARRAEDGIVLDFPAQPPRQADAPDGLAAALGTMPDWVGRNDADLLVELGSAAMVRSLQPDMAALRAIDARGVIVTAVSDDVRYDFVSRFFAPRVGVDEDPVTGSAHTALGPFWAHRLERTTLTGYQASRRGGVVGVSLRGDRVDLHGRAITVLSGMLVGAAAS